MGVIAQQVRLLPVDSTDAKVLLESINREIVPMLRSLRESNNALFATRISRPAALEVENPSGSERIVWFRNYVEITVNGIDAVLAGSASPSVTFSIRYDEDRSAVGTELLTGGRTVTSTTTGTSFAPDVTVIPAGVWVWLQTTARSGTVLELTAAMDLRPSP